MESPAKEWMKFKRGDTWRSNKIYRCKICHVKTNKWEMGGWPGTHPVILCPGREYIEHDELEDLIKRHQEITRKIEEYKKLLPELPETKAEDSKNLIKNLEAEKTIIEIKIRKIRDKFAKANLNDIEGLPENAEIIDYYPTIEYRGKKKKLPK